MRIFLAGLPCVGKSTIGARLAHILGFSFCDLDIEAENFFSAPIRRVRATCKTQYRFLGALAQVLAAILDRPGDLVVALPPDGLFMPLWNHIRKANGVVILLTDTPANIAKRMIFFDVDSKSVNITLSAKQESTYVRKIESDLRYLRHTLSRARVSVDIADLSIDDAVKKVHLSVLGFM